MTQDHQIQRANLYRAFTKLKTLRKAERFLKDLLTPEELSEFSRRFQIATYLWTTADSYARIASRIKTSTTTVTRVARFLWKEEHQGYKLVLQRLWGKKR